MDGSKAIFLIVPKWICRFSVVATKIPVGSSAETDKRIGNVTWELKNIWVSPEKEKVERTTLSGSNSSVSECSPRHCVISQRTDANTGEQDPAVNTHT